MNFAAIIRSPEAIRNAFSSVTGLRLWWRMVLVLHGEPVADSLTDQERAATLVRGFRFYGFLYRSLGILMAVGTAAWLISDSSFSWYWGAALAFGALYLIASSSLAFQGADRLGVGQLEGAALLVTFFISIIIFLAVFGAMVSSWIHGSLGKHDFANVLVLAAFILFGIGSYLLEVLYLVWWKRPGG